MIQEIPDWREALFIPKGFSRALEKAIYKKHNGHCAICDEETEFDQGEIDHIIPLSKGGSDEPENLQWVCHRCNKLKGNRLDNRQVRRLLGLPEDYEEFQTLLHSEKKIEELPKEENLQELPVLSKDGLDVSEIDRCINALYESHQKETIVPHISRTKDYERIMDSSQFVNISINYRLPRKWFVRSETTYYNIPLFSQFGRSIALGEREYFHDRILNVKGSEIDVDFSPKGILEASKKIDERGLEADIVWVPVSQWIKMQGWSGETHVKYSNVDPQPFLNSSLIMEKKELKILAPLGNIPKYPILFSHDAILWHIRRFPEHGALFIALGNDSLYKLIFVTLVAGTMMRCEIQPEGVAVIKRQ